MNRDDIKEDSFKSSSIKGTKEKFWLRAEYFVCSYKDTIAKIVQNQKGLRATFILPSLIHNDRFI